MCRRNVLKKFQLFDAADSTLDPASGHTSVSQLDFITYENSIDASVDAVLEVQYCNDEVFNAANLKSLDFGAPINLDGAVDTDYTIHIDNMGFKWLLLKITNNAGTGDVSAWITGNVRGA